jgi:hypothetical protein
MLGITLVNVIPAIKPHKGGPEPSAGIGATKAVFWAFMYLTVGNNVSCVHIWCGPSYFTASRSMSA